MQLAGATCAFGMSLWWRPSRYLSSSQRGLPYWASYTTYSGAPVTHWRGCCTYWSLMPPRGSHGLGRPGGWPGWAALAACSLDARCMAPRRCMVHVRFGTGGQVDAWSRRELNPRVATRMGPWHLGIGANGGVTAHRCSLGQNAGLRTHIHATFGHYSCHRRVVGAGIIPVCSTAWWGRV